MNSWRIILYSLLAVLLYSAIRPDILLAAERQQQAPQHQPSPEQKFAPLPEGYAPIVPLTVYQKRWIEDQSRLKIGMFTRQGGKSFGTALEAVIDCFQHKTTWVFLSAGERQSKELMNKAAMHAKAMNCAILELTEQFKDENDNRTEYKQLEIIFPNGSRIIGLPANPATARGHSANILLDEFALHKDSRAIWTALYPSITRGYKIRIISTPLGKKNKFYELWTGRTLQIFDGTAEVKYVGERGGYSKHKVTIYDAVEMGLNLYDDEGEPSEPEDLRLGLADDEAWHQEFLCEFVDEQTAFLTYDLIESCEDCTLDYMPHWAEQLLAKAISHHEAYKGEEVPPPFEAWDILSSVLFPGELYAGFDIARTRDLSVIWLDEEINKVGRARAVIAMKGQPYAVQEYVLWSLIKLPQMRRVCIDQTGLGNQLAERAIKIWPSIVEGVTFNNASKEALAVGLKKNLEDRREALPPDTTIRQSLHAIKKVATSAGNFRYDADRDEKIGHADHFWAKALAVQARGAYAGPVWGTSRGERTSKKMLEGYADAA